MQKEEKFLTDIFSAETISIYSINSSERLPFTETGVCLNFTGPFSQINRLNDQNVAWTIMISVKDS